MREYLRIVAEIEGSARTRGKAVYPLGLACFHAQPAAQKTLKAVLAAAGTGTPRTHDLVALLMLAPF